MLKCFPKSGLKWIDDNFPLFWGRGLGAFQISLELETGEWGRARKKERKNKRKNEGKNKQTHKENDTPAKTTEMIQKTTVCSIKADGELNKDYKQNLWYSLAMTGDYREQQNSDQPLWTPGSGFVQT